MRLCNELVYGEVLQCGSDAIASSRLVLANIAPLEVRRQNIRVIFCVRTTEVLAIRFSEQDPPRSMSTPESILVWLQERANWIQEALSCKKGDEVVFLDTEQV